MLTDNSLSHWWFWYCSNYSQIGNSAHKVDRLVTGYSFRYRLDYSQSLLSKFPTTIGVTTQCIYELISSRIARPMSPSHIESVATEKIWQLNLIGGIQFRSCIGQPSFVHFSAGGRSAGLSESESAGRSSHTNDFDRSITNPFSILNRSNVNRLAW